MLHWALVFFVIALVAALLGFRGVAGMSAQFGYLFALLADTDPQTLPPLYIGCGTEDPLHDFNVSFAKEATAAGADVTTDFRPGEH